MNDPTLKKHINTKILFNVNPKYSKAYLGSRQIIMMEIFANFFHEKFINHINHMFSLWHSHPFNKTLPPPNFINSSPHLPRLFLPLLLLGTSETDIVDVFAEFSNIVVY